MRRRSFIQISSLGVASLLVDGCANFHEYDITFLNDMAVGHLAFESHHFPTTQTRSTKCVIVGGGISGLSAAYHMRHQDIMLFELSDMIGGSSAGSSYKNIPLCHGAHYDLSYPNNYGREGLNMLENLNIIQYDQFSNSWNFVDKQYLISKHKESQTFAHGNIRKDVLPEGETKTAFTTLMKSFSGKMPMPTRHIGREYRYLNDISFIQWLKQHFPLSEGFIEGLHYHMKDDYGADASQVSALAGIHYFACRPYYTKPVELFSPPEGNSYFVHKIYNELSNENIFTSHLVKLIHEKEKGFEVEVVDAAKKEVLKVNCDKIIYAGNKHALKFIFQKDMHLFQKNHYAPWVVVNFILKQSVENSKRKTGGQAYWQNEIISDDKSLLGFVDSKAQVASTHKHRVLTVYYCFRSDEREMMSNIEDRKQTFINRTLEHLEKYYDQALKSHVEKVFVKQMGHAMPIPRQGYLFNDANENRSNPDLVYAGVDNGRLPLLFEAIDSGIEACKSIMD